MGQVPYGIIGNGRAARHLCHYLTLLNIPYRQWAREQHTSAYESLKDCSPILILLKDDSIPEFLEQNPALTKLTLRHCSATLSLTGVPSAHPLATFGAELYDLESYRKLYFTISSDGPPFSELLPGLSNPHVTLAPTQRTFYHTLAVMSGNFTVLLWQKALREFEKTLQLPQEMLIPYCEQIFKNLISHPHTALTGPLVRGDLLTIEKHLQALEGDAFQKVYSAFCQAYKEEHPE